MFDIYGEVRTVADADDGQTDGTITFALGRSRFVCVFNSNNGAFHDP